MLHTQMLGCHNFNRQNGPGLVTTKGGAGDVTGGSMRVEVAASTASTASAASAASPESIQVQGVALYRSQYTTCLSSGQYGYGWAAGGFFIVYVAIGSFLLLQLVVGGACIMLRQYIQVLLVLPVLVVGRYFSTGRLHYRRSRFLESSQILNDRTKSAPPQIPPIHV